MSLLILAFALLGLSVGSFLNVCIDRLPQGQSIINPPSHCSACNRKLGILDLVPLFSYLWLRGRCRYRSQRQMFPAICAQCGKETEVPFEPREGRPVYCSECYSKVRLNR